MSKLNPNKQAIVKIMRKHDIGLAEVIKARFMAGTPVLTMARRLEKMATDMRNISLQQELNKP